MSVRILQQLIRRKLSQPYLVYSESVVLLNSSIGRNCFYCPATTALAISTIVLGVKHADLKSQLEEREEPIVPTTEPTITEPPIDMEKYRLPTVASPTSYDLYLYPDLQTGLFKGKITAETTIKQTTFDIIMNSHLLNITKVTIDGNSGVFELDKDFERFSIKKSDFSAFSLGTVGITVEFEGDMKNRIVGLYSSSYTNPEGLVRYMATSKFEPTYARQAFPCFDEPNMKATYKVHLLKPKDEDYIALSNYPEMTSEEVDDGILVHFGETVPMSTYLSCFIVSDFISTNTSFENNGTEIPFRVYASPHQLNKTTYAGYVGKKAIEYFITYFNIPYPLPKLDLVAIPDFVSGAMEHWGLVTFRETALLYDSSTHSESNKQRVADVVSHELAHSWFGNLVTMDWWDNLWLNEGFATYIADKGVNAAEPDWKMLDSFQIRTLHSILSLDATQGSHPIIQTVITPDQITEVFDSVSYNKGASVLRMLEYVITETSFQKGVTNYLNRHKFGNAVSQDLWDEIQTEVGTQLNVTEFMDTFTVQMGYAILDAKVNGNTFTFTQKRFLKDYDSVEKQKNSPLNYKWSIPITYVTDLGEEKQITWFAYTTNEVSVEKPAAAKWIKFNPSQVGYYRVNYPESHWNLLIENIKDMLTTDRTHLLEESFSIAESGDLSYTIPLTLTKYLTDETEYVPWSVASSQLQPISRYLGTSQFDADFKKYVISLLKPTYDRLGWDDSNSTESHLDKLCRVVILNLACAMEDGAALNEARTLFQQWMVDTTTNISPNLRDTVYKYGMVTADEETWNKLFEIFAKEEDASEKLKLMNGLANVRNPSLLTKLIEVARTETHVRSQDYFTLLQYISANPVGAPIVWDYVRENWEWLVDRFTLNDRYLGRLIPSITGRFSTNLKYDEINHFFAKYPNAGAGAAARVQALETVANNIKWLDKYKKVIENWIDTLELKN